jgi:hypothetical protein
MRQHVAVIVNALNTSISLVPSTNFSTLNEVHLVYLMAFSVDDTVIIVQRMGFADKSRAETECHLHEKVGLIVEIGSEKFTEVREDVIVQIAYHNGFLKRHGEHRKEIFFIRNSGQTIFAPVVAEMEHDGFLHRWG